MVKLSTCKGITPAGKELFCIQCIRFALGDNMVIYFSFAVPSTKLDSDFTKMVQALVLIYFCMMWMVYVGDMF